MLVFAVTSNVAMDFHLLQVNFQGLLLEEVRIEGLWDMCVLSARCWQFILQNGCSNEYIINRIEYFSNFSISPVLDSTELASNLYRFDGYKWYLIVLIFIFHSYCWVEHSFICAISHSNFSSAIVACSCSFIHLLLVH